MKKEKFIWFNMLIASLLITACSNPTAKVESPEMIKAAADTKALTLMHQYCFTCHNPDLEIDKRLAPPMFMVRNHYYDSIITKEDFVNKIVTYANNPSVELSIMPGAVRGFGVMPKQVFNQEDLKLIAAYIYENDLESDAWYAKYNALLTAAQTKPSN